MLCWNSRIQHQGLSCGSCARLFHFDCLAEPHLSVLEKEKICPVCVYYVAKEVLAGMQSHLNLPYPALTQKKKKEESKELDIMEKYAPSSDGVELLGTPYVSEEGKVFYSAFKLRDVVYNLLDIVIVAKQSEAEEEDEGVVGDDVPSFFVGQVEAIWDDCDRKEKEMRICWLFWPSEGALTFVWICLTLPSE